MYVCTILIKARPEKAVMMAIERQFVVLFAQSLADPSRFSHFRQLISASLSLPAY
mgnify:CR=1 FL=1